MTHESEELQQLVGTRVRRMNAVALAIAAGVLAGLALFCMTMILVVKGAPAGEQVGPHLSLLGQFLPGYTVTVGGSFLGFIYAYVIGFVIVFVGASLYNAVARVRDGRK